MKNNIFSYLFFVFIIGIIGFAIYKVNEQNINKNGQETDSQTSFTETKKGNSLVLGISEFDTINPIITKNRKVQNVTKIIYESLVDISSEGKAEPCLAREWETADNTTYIVKLKTGIKWNDGTYFSSNDVKYTIDRLKESKASVYSENVKYVKEVDVIDNVTLRIILSQKVSFFEYYLNFPILSSNFYSKEDFWKTKKNKAPITTGRFVISGVTGNTIELTKNKNWWNIENDNSIIEKVTINLYSSVAELYNAFKLGSIDLIATQNDNYKEYIGTIGYNVYETEGRNFVFLALNTKSKVLSDKNVRQALRCAINKEEISSNVYKGAYMKANFPLLTSSFLVNDKNENYYNIGEMERLLQKAGWSFRSKHWQKNINYRTYRMELNLVVNKNSNREKVTDYIKSKFAANGINVNVIKVSKENYQKYLANKNYDMILCEATQSIAPDLNTYFGDYNLANFYTDETNEIMRYIDNITDENELKSKFQKLYEIYNEEVPYIGIARNKIYVISNSYLTAEVNARWYNLFFNLKDWYTD